jgi:hypothetical protein
VVIALRADASAASGVETATRLQDTGAPRNRRLDVRARVLRHLPSHSRHHMKRANAARNRTAQLLPRGLTVAKRYCRRFARRRTPVLRVEKRLCHYEALSSDCRCGSGYRHRTDPPENNAFRATSSRHYSSTTHPLLITMARISCAPCASCSGMLVPRYDPPGAICAIPQTPRPINTKYCSIAQCCPCHW